MSDACEHLELTDEDIRDLADDLASAGLDYDEALARRVARVLGLAIERDHYGAHHSASRWVGAWSKDQ